MPKAKRPRPFDARLAAWPLALFLLLLVSMIQAQAQDRWRADWSGTWETLWRGGGARLILKQDGDRVSGTYPLYEGKIEASAVGRELRGEWLGEDSSGSFVFVQSADGQSFTGRYDSGEWWTGVRGGAGRAGGPFTDHDSPMAAMRTFLAAANAAVDGNLEALGTAVTMVRAADGSDLGAEQFDHAQALYFVIDQTTLRLWDLPREQDAGEGRVTVELEQAGTGQSIAVTFRRDEGLWYIESPPLAQLEATLARLRAARGKPYRVAAEASGPDFFNVVGVATDDVLNIRAGAGANHAKIGEIPPDADGVRNLGCVGGLSFAEWQNAKVVKRPIADAGALVHTCLGLAPTIKVERSTTEVVIRQWAIRKGVWFAVLHNFSWEFNRVGNPLRLQLPDLISALPGQQEQLYDVAERVVFILGTPLASGH